MVKRSSFVSVAESELKKKAFHLLFELTTGRIKYVTQKIKGERRNCLAFTYQINSNYLQLIVIFLCVGLS